MKQVRLILLAACTLLTAGQIKAQTVQITGHSVVTNPVTSCTDTYVATTTQLGCINAVHIGNTFSITGTNIIINNEYTLGPICLARNLCRGGVL